MLKLENLRLSEAKVGKKYIVNQLQLNESNLILLAQIHITQNVVIEVIDRQKTGLMVIQTGSGRFIIDPEIAKGIFLISD